MTDRGRLQSRGRFVDGEVGGRNLAVRLTHRRPFKRLALGLLAVAAWPAGALAADPERDSFDAGDDVTAEVPAAVEEARDDLRGDLGRQGLLSVDDSTGSIRFLAKLDGYLTGATSDAPAEAARDYITDQAEAFGVEPADVGDLRVAGTETAEGIDSVEFTQRVDGVPVIDSSLVAHVDPDGRLLAVTGGLVPNAQLNTTTPDVPRSDALEAASEGVANPGAADSSSLVAYGTDTDLRLAWRVLVVASSTGVYDTLVDARTGDVVRRSNLVKFATAPVFENYPGAAAGGTQGVRSFGAGWLDPPTPTRLRGPNVHAFVDREDEVPGDSLTNPVQEPSQSPETPPTSGDNFNYPFDEFAPSPGPDDYGCAPSARCSWDPKLTPSGSPPLGDWAPDGNQAATQLFYYANLFHDHLRDAAGIGFGPSSGSFEGDNDRVIAQAQDGAASLGGQPDLDHVNNANMLVLPDGQHGYMQMYLWDPVADPGVRPVHGGDDAGLVFHEYTHGMNNRLVTDAAGFGALNGAQAGAIDEGTSDWYALDYLVERGLVADGGAPDLTVARYAVRRATGIRNQATDCLPGPSSTMCPTVSAGAGPGGFTYGDFGKVRGNPEVHDDGEIWTQALWQLRKRLLVAHPADGIERARRLVTGALRLVPPNPSFLDMRNAILLADGLAAGNDRPLIWDVFADRGMGYAASTRGTHDVASVQDFTEPPTGASSVGTMTGTVRDQDSGAPLANALVAFSGHDSGLGEDLSDHTAADGSYRITNVPARTWDYVAVAPATGYDRVLTEDVAVAGGGATTVRNFSVRRNWALRSGGAAIQSATPPDFSSFGCGPSSAIDGTRSSGWSTTTGGARDLTVRLPQAITLGEVRIDPSAICGDEAVAALGRYEVYASPDAVVWTRVAAGAFGTANRGSANAVALASRPAGTRYVRLRALGSQGDPQFMDVAELQVYAGTPVVIPPPPPPPAPPVQARLRLLNKKAKIGRRGRFVIKLAGPRGARVESRFTVVVRRGGASRRMTLAKAKFRLSSSGRARVVVKISKRTLRRLRARKLRVSVIVRAAGQRKEFRLSLTNPPKPKKKTAAQRR